MADQPDKNRIETARIDILRQELLAPILSIAGHTELLKEHLSDHQDFDGLDDLKRIEHASYETRSLVNAMLEGEMNYPSKATRDEQRAIFIHDLRNAVGVIAGYSEMLLEDLSEAEPEDTEGLSYLEQTIAESNRILQQLDQIFTAADAATTDSNASLNEDLSAVFDSFERNKSSDELFISGNLLIVDDNESSLNLLSHQLKKQGHQTRTASSGRMALKMMAEQSPDLVLLDLLMGDMNGFEVLQVMRKDEKLRAIPVIVVTGLQDKEGAARCIEVGAFDILVKPVNPMLLKARVSACLERKSWHDKEKEYQAELEKSYAFIRKVFGRYLSDDIVKTILEDDDGLQLGGGKQKVTVMMTDIRGFTALSQSLDPVDCVTLLNNYFEQMTPLLLKHGGTIDEFLGDAILAIFGAPIKRDDDAERALLCAIEMQCAMQAVNRKNLEMGLPEIQMGIGLNTGEVVVGNIGSLERSKYGIVGHHVNLTSRIESFTVGGQILASEYTIIDSQADVILGETAEVSAKGIKEPIRIHEVLGLAAPHYVTLDEMSEQMTPIATELAVTLAELSGKAIDKAAIPGFITAISKNCLQIKSTEPLQRFTNLSITFIENSEWSSEQVYAKVTARGEQGEQFSCYTLNITSCPEIISNELDLLAQDKDQSDTRGKINA